MSGMSEEESYHAFVSARYAALRRTAREANVRIASDAATAEKAATSPKRSILLRIVGFVLT